MFTLKNKPNQTPYSVSLKQSNKFTFVFLRNEYLILISPRMTATPNIIIKEAIAIRNVSEEPSNRPVLCSTSSSDGAC